MIHRRAAPFGSIRPRASRAAEE